MRFIRSAYSEKNMVRPHTHQNKTLHRTVQLAYKEEKKVAAARYDAAAFKKNKMVMFIEEKVPESLCHACRKTIA